MMMLYRLYIRVTDVMSSKVTSNVIVGRAYNTVAIMRSSELLAVAAAFLVVFVLDLGLAEVSNRLETELSPVQPGQPLDLACTVTSPQSRVDTCSWNTPDGHTYSIDGLVVTDENSDLVPGVVVDPNDPASCKITVLQLSPEQVGEHSKEPLV